MSRPLDYFRPVHDPSGNTRQWRIPAPAIVCLSIAIGNFVMVKFCGLEGLGLFFGAPLFNIACAVIAVMCKVYLDIEGGLFWVAAILTPILATIVCWAIGFAHLPVC